MNDRFIDSTGPKEVIENWSMLHSPVSTNPRTREREKKKEGNAVERNVRDSDILLCILCILRVVVGWMEYS